MTQQHPINPPPELLQRLCVQADATWIDRLKLAYQAGADAELQACCEWADRTGWQGAGDSLRAARRPKPQSLKEQGIKSLDAVVDCLKALVPGASADGEHIKTIRRALEQLPDHTSDSD